jgi:predicted nucleic acid-binding protein
LSKPFVDSKVILYLLSGDTAKADRAQDIVAAGAVISVQVLNEVTSVCHRKLKLPWSETEALLMTVKAACEVVPLTLTSHEKAVALAKGFSLSFYEAHIVACAVLSGAQRLLTEDLQDGLKIETLSVHNPFKL